MILPEPPAAWRESGAFDDPAWPALQERLAQETRPCAPAPENVFRALRLTPPEAARVVILGQDPYPQAGRSVGLAFSFPPGERPRHSLANILSELRADTGLERADGDLSGWAAQGVLLLNAVLTVPLGLPHGHYGWGWEAVTGALLRRLALRREVIFVLWGKDAIGLAEPILQAAGRSGEHVIRSSHPSGNSRFRGVQGYPPFAGSRPFSRIDAWLEEMGEPPIDWGRAGA